MRFYLLVTLLSAQATWVNHCAQETLSAKDIADIEKAAAVHVARELRGDSVPFDPRVRDGERSEERANQIAHILKAKKAKKESVYRCLKKQCTIDVDVLVAIGLPGIAKEGVRISVEVLERMHNDPVRVGAHFSQREFLVAKQGNAWSVIRLLRARVA